MTKAAELTARQLQQAIDVVAGKLGADRAQQDGALVGAVLAALADNYREKTK
ncbi:MAG: hypothetical protein ACXWCU_10585 [Caldimonas sp.]